MNKTDYISGTEDAYSLDLIKVQVSGPKESEKSIGALVDLIFDERGINTAASRLEWFPKSRCHYVKIPSPDTGKFMPTYFLYAPEWILVKKNVEFKK